MKLHVSQEHPAPADEGRSSEKGGNQSKIVSEFEAKGAVECEASSRKRNRKGRKYSCDCGRRKRHSKIECKEAMQEKRGMISH